MALIKCYECGKEISSLAPHCIHCGAPRKAQKKKKASKRKISDDGLTERQREQLERIRATSTKRPTKKKITKKAVKKKSPAKKRIASAYESHIDLVGGRSPRAARNYIDSDASNRDISRSKNVSKKKSTAKRPTKKKTAKKVSKDLEKQVPIDWGGWDTYLSTIQWKAVISQTAVLFVVSFILAFLVSWVIKSLMAIAVINFIVVVAGFTLIHYFTEENRLQHCIHVAVALWLAGIINVVLGYPFISWLLGVFVIPVLMIIGIAISYLIGLSKND